MKIGLYFGSFNPLHIGHLIIANHTLNEDLFDEVWFVVSPQNPLKNKTELLSPSARLDLIKLSIKGEKKLKASEVEFKLPVPSYTIDTLKYLQLIYPENIFFIIMGSDSYQNLSQWKNYKELESNYKIYVYNRPSSEIKNVRKKSAFLLKAPLLDISSTRIRELIKKGKSIKFLVPNIVKKEIEKKGYFK